METRKFYSLNRNVDSEDEEETGDQFQVNDDDEILIGVGGDAETGNVS